MNLTAKQLILGSLLFIASAAQADNPTGNGYLQNAWTSFKCLIGAQLATRAIKSEAVGVAGLFSYVSYSAWCDKVAAVRGAVPLRYQVPILLAQKLIHHTPTLIRATRVAKVSGLGYFGYNVGKATDSTSNRVIEA